VQPEAAVGSTVRVAALAADFAAALLARRFGVLGSGGISELVADAAADAGSHAESQQNAFSELIMAIESHDVTCSFARPISA